MELTDANLQFKMSISLFFSKASSSTIISHYFLLLKSAKCGMGPNVYITTPPTSTLFTLFDKFQELDCSVSDSAC